MKNIGIIGIGNISRIYLGNLTGMFGTRVNVTAVADIIFENAEKAAGDYGIKAFRSAGEMIQSDEVDIILNLTPPSEHYTIALAAINAGKHVYNEKPLCIKREEAAQLLETGAHKGVRIGGAPDTFLGAGIQTCHKLINDGCIGRPVAATAFVMGRGPEGWHPAPDFFYKTGGGPMFDMGPYYLTALVSLMGPVARVSGSARISSPERTITNQVNPGAKIKVDVPTHIVSVLDFAAGPVGTLITSFDICSHSLPYIEIYGTDGTIKVPDPNTFGGPVFLKRFPDENWDEIPLLEGYPENSRGLGITDMAEAIEENRPHKTSGELAFHVLDIMHGVHEASASGKYYNCTTSACSSSG